MQIGVAVCELHLPGARSLKEKRKVVKSAVERIHQRFRISIAETDYHDLHQRAELGLALVTTDRSELERIFGEVRRLLDDLPDAFLTLWDVQDIEGVR